MQVGPKKWKKKKKKKRRKEKKEKAKKKNVIFVNVILSVLTFYTSSFSLNYSRECIIFVLHVSCESNLHLIST
jgi:hypothetical protein